MQDLKEVRRLREGDITLWIGNGAKVATEAIGIYPLRLSSDFRLVLKDCYYVSVASRNLIFVFVLA